jgi:O-antigen ligase
VSQLPDPWERREAERARYRNKQGEPRDLFDELQRHQRPLGLLFFLALLLVAEVPLLGASVRLYLSIGATIGLLLLLASCRDYTEPLRDFLMRAPNFLWLLSLLYGLGSFLWAPNTTVATGELVRLLAGAGAYLVAGYTLKDRRELGLVLGGLICLGCGIALYDIAHFAQKTGLRAGFSANNLSILGTHESVGSLLALLLPVALTLGLSRALEERGRLLAQAATLVLGFAWIMVRCRSAWLGGIVALLFMGFLLWRYPLEKAPTKQGAKHRWKEVFTSPIVLVIGALVVMGLVAGVAPLLSKRAGALFNPLEDGSLGIRLVMWNGALRMLSMKPVLGWGLGGYLLLQGRWTHLGDAPEQVLLYGTGHQNIAHNYYLQWAAETGLIGLFLFGVSSLALLAYAYRALVKLSGAWERTLIIACLTSLCGALVEVSGSPAFQFCGVWAVFWTLAGVLLASARLAEPIPKLASQPLSLVSSVLLAALACCMCLWLGNRLWDPRGEPRGVFQLVEQTRGPYHPGETVRWRAVYQSRTGKDLPTHPGTDWVPPVWFEQGTVRAPRPVQSQEWSLQRALRDSSTGYSELALRLPSEETGMIQVQAVFQDAFGRSYSASRVADVVVRQGTQK